MGIFGENVVQLIVYLGWSDKMIQNAPIKKKRGSMRKLGSGILDKKMSLPGQSDIFHQIIPGNTPLQDGTYLVYYEYDAPSAWSKTKQVAGVTAASFANGKWGINYKVFAYMGPLPSLSLDPLQECEPPYLINQTFYVATLEQAVNDVYDFGPFPQFMLAFLQPGKDGRFIFCKDSEERYPYPIAKWSDAKKEEGIYVSLSKKAINKYIKRIDHKRG
jgi:hypothetical protein